MLGVCLPCNSLTLSSCQQKYLYEPIPVPGEPLCKAKDLKTVPYTNCAAAAAASKILLNLEAQKKVEEGEYGII
jgi:hypothetical protein